MGNSWPCTISDRLRDPMLCMYIVFKYQCMHSKQELSYLFCEINSIGLTSLNEYFEMAKHLISVPHEVFLKQNHRVVLTHSEISRLFVTNLKCGG